VKCPLSFWNRRNFIYFSICVHSNSIPDVYIAVIIHNPSNILPISTSTIHFKTCKTILFIIHSLKYLHILSPSIYLKRPLTYFFYFGCRSTCSNKMTFNNRVVLNKYIIIFTINYWFEKKITMTKTYLA